MRQFGAPVATRWLASTAVGIALVLVVVGAPGRPAAAPVMLDEMLRAHLASLPPLNRVAAQVQVGDDRVLVVSFFASWCPPCHEGATSIDCTPNMIRPRSASWR